MKRFKADNGIGNVTLVDIDAGARTPVSWTISARELADGVELARQELDEYRDWDTLEVLARAVRWADQLAESRRLFGEAAADAVDAIAGHGEYAGDVCSRTAGYFALAGEPEQGREWAARAVADFRAPAGLPRRSQA